MQNTILIIITMICFNSFGQESDSDCSNYFDSLSNRKIYTFVDEMPVFSNKKGFLVNLVSSMKIDDITEIRDTKGSVKLVVEISGNVSDISIVDTINKHIDKQVYDFVVKSKWKPGLCNERLVPVKMIIPYSFDF